MSYKRFFVNVIEGDNVIIEGDEHNHLCNVLRLKNGEEITLICGDQYDYIAQIVNIEKRKTTVKVIDKKINVANPKVKLTAFVGLIKGDNFSLVIQKLCELGVSEIYPLSTKYTVVKADKPEKWQKIANQSIKQCQRSIPLIVHSTITTKQMCEILKNYDATYFACETDRTNKIECNLKNKNVAMIVGPEGGFSEDEIKQIISCGAISITLGNRILRAETANIALASILMNKYGEM